MPPSVRLLDGGYRSRLKPVPGAPEVLQRLARRSRGLLFVTARPHVGPIDDFMRGILADEARVRSISSPPARLTARPKCCSAAASRISSKTAWRPAFP